MLARRGTTIHGVKERFFYTMFSKRMDKYTGMFILKLNLLELKSQ